MRLYEYKKKTFAPEEVLVAVISHYVNTELSEDMKRLKTTKITGSFVDDDGTVEICIVDESDSKKLN